ncbi:MAG: hypothetical protein JRG76_12090 [Deltaproteobacteria bacterium]|nr:hypothetical protein [Deltaproteobacteria bacterium]MBW2415237.1 hypothetical protein [Deltaproteobacteria bacterium]
MFSSLLEQYAGPNDWVLLDFVGIEMRELRRLARQHERDDQSRKYGGRWKPKQTGRFQPDCICRVRPVSFAG